MYISNDILLSMCRQTKDNILYIYACYMYIYIYGVAHIVYFPFPHLAGRMVTRLQRSSAAQAGGGVFKTPRSFYWLVDRDSPIGLL